MRNCLKNAAKDKTDIIIAEGLCHGILAMM